MKNHVALGSVFRGVTALIAITMPVFFYYCEQHTYFDLVGLLLSEGICLAVFASSGRFSRAYPITWVMNLVVVLMVCLRLLMLSLFPRWLFAHDRTRPEYFTPTVAYIFVGLLIAYAGIAHGHVLARANTRLNKVRGRHAPIQSAFWLLLICVAVNVFNREVFGYVGATGSGEHLGFFSRYIVRLFNPNMACGLVLVSYFFSPHQNARKYLVSALMVNFLYLTLGGSRAGFFELTLVYLCAATLFLREIYVRLGINRAIIGMLILALLPTIYEATTVLRTAQWYGTDTTRRSIDLVVENISRRLSLIESTMHPMFMSEMNFYDINDLVNVQTTVLSSLNRLIPGKPFGTIIFSEMACGHMYIRGGVVAQRTWERTDFVGYEWGMWGISYQLFGGPGGLIFIYLFTLGLAFLVCALCRRNTYGAYSIAFLMTYTMHVWVRNLGLDNLIDRTFHDFVVLAGYLVLLHSPKALSIAKGLTPQPAV